jgi:hypothetical protein
VNLHNGSLGAGGTHRGGLRMRGMHCAPRSSRRGSNGASSRSVRGIRAPRRLAHRPAAVRGAGTRRAGGVGGRVEALEHAVGVVGRARGDLGAPNPTEISPRSPATPPRRSVLATTTPPGATTPTTPRSPRHTTRPRPTRPIGPAVEARQQRSELAARAPARTVPASINAATPAPTRTFCGFVDAFRVGHGGYTRVETTFTPASLTSVPRRTEFGISAIASTCATSCSRSSGPAAPASSTSYDTASDTAGSPLKSPRTTTRTVFRSISRIAASLNRSFETHPPIAR